MMETWQARAAARAAEVHAAAMQRGADEAEFLLETDCNEKFNLGNVIVSNILQEEYLRSLYDVEVSSL